MVKNTPQRYFKQKYTQYNQFHTAVKQWQYNILYFRVLSVSWDACHIWGNSKTSSSLNFHIFRPPVWHGSLKSHRGVIRRFECQRFFGVSQADQAQAQLSNRCSVLPGWLARLRLQRSALLEVLDWGWQAHWHQALPNHTSVMGPGCELLANVTALAKADTLHVDKIWLQW